MIPDFCKEIGANSVRFTIRDDIEIYARCFFEFNNVNTINLNSPYARRELKAMRMILAARKKKREREKRKEVEFNIRTVARRLVALQLMNRKYVCTFHGCTDAFAFDDTGDRRDLERFRIDQSHSLCLILRI
jgi:hypothetical protein